MDGLDLEEYKSQIKETDSEHQIKLVGLKEGLLYKHNESNSFNSHDEEYFYGFENHYGLHIQRKIGFAETEGAKEGLYQVTPYGLAVKPSKMMRFNPSEMGAVTELLSDEMVEKIHKMCEQAIEKKISRDLSHNFECVEKDDIKKILSLVKKLPARKPEKEITERGLNSDLIKQEDIEIV